MVPNFTISQIAAFGGPARAKRRNYVVKCGRAKTPELIFFLIFFAA
jgi:hypothetical protein